MPIKGHNTYLKNSLFFGIIGIVLLGNTVFMYLHFKGIGLPEKKVHYLTPANIVKKLNKNSARITKLYDDKLKYYNNKVLDFYNNIKITLLLCLIGTIVMFRQNDINIPYLSSVSVPISITYLVISGALCYFWLQFGFLLNYIINTRIGLEYLISAEYAISNPDAIDSFGKVTIPYDDYCTITHANNLLDTGFIDSWFLIFLPQYTQTSPLDGTTFVIIAATMIAVGLTYAISHGFSIGLAFNWLERFGNRNSKKGRFEKGIAITLICITATFILSSHIAFYYYIPNINWLQFIIVYAAIAAFCLITKSKFHKAYEIK